MIREKKKKNKSISVWARSSDWCTQRAAPMNTLNRSVHVLEGPTNNPKTRIVLISEWIKRWLGLTQDNGSRLTFELGEEGEDGGDFLITCKTQNDFGSATYEVEVVCRRCQGRRDRSSMRGYCGGRPWRCEGENSLEP
jgi:hypothetical protein